LTVSAFAAFAAFVVFAFVAFVVLAAFAVVLYRCRGGSFVHCGRGEGWIGRDTIMIVEYLPALLKRVRF
jgi:hypothetical protein